MLYILYIILWEGWWGGKTGYSATMLKLYLGAHVWLSLKHQSSFAGPRGAQLKHQ
jgi:hypothetical protein